MNTNPNAKRILCFGDSLTWGYETGSNHNRYNSDKRWTGILQIELGDDFEVIEEGLNSRLITSEDNRSGKEGRRSLDYIVPCLDTHDPIDYIIVLLGTNELKFEMNKTPKEIKDSMRELLEIIKNHKSQMRDIEPQIILLAPPHVNESSSSATNNDKYKFATAKSEQLADEYKRLAEELNIKFLDLSKLVKPGIDGVHIDETSHMIVGKELAKLIV